MRFVILVIVVIVAVAAGLLLLKVANQPASAPVALPASQGAPTSNVATVDVLVARVDIPVGTVINESMIDRQPWPQHLLLEGFVTANQPNANLVGMVARSDFKAREPFILSKLAKPNDASFLASSLPKGMRAVTVSVDPISGVAGYIFPGDRVDVLLAHSVPQEAGSRLWGEDQQMGASASQKPTTAEVLIPNLKVLAVNLRGSAQQAQQQAEGNNNAPPRIDPPSSVTLAVTQDDAKKLRLADKNGTMSLALRSLNDENDNGVGSAVSLLDLSRVSGDEYNQHADWRHSHAPRGMAAAPGMPRSGMQQDEVVIIRGVEVDHGNAGMMMSPAAAMPAMAPANP
jgi:pilus assembly protein CpaB